MSFGDGPAATGRTQKLNFVLRVGYQVAQRFERSLSWSIKITSYAYNLSAPRGADIISYHWHPEGRSPVTYPHLHIGGQTRPIDLSKAHLPTGIVPLTDVVRMTITELGVEPLRPNWESVLAEATHVSTA